MFIAKYIKANSIDLFFIIAVFALPVIGKILFQVSTINIRVVFVSVVALWALYKCLFSKTTLLKISLIDVGFFAFILFVVFHFCYYSKASLYYYQAWIYIAYILLFYMFRWVLLKETQRTDILKSVLIIILTVSYFEITVALLQYFELISANNPYFKLLGSFTSPNFFGAFVGLSLIVMIWFYFIKYPNKKASRILVISGVGVYLGIILLSGSRSTILAVIISLGILVVTSKKGKALIKSTSFLKKLLFGVLFMLLTILGTKYLYHLKPESVKGRALIAKIALNQVVERPVMGHGLFSFPGTYNKAKAQYFKVTEQPWNEKKVATYVFTPFNEFLLVVFELGFLGLVLLVGPVVYTIKNTRMNTNTRLALAILGNLFVLACFNAVSSSIVLVAFGLLALVLILRDGHFWYVLALPSYNQRNYAKPLLLVVALFLIYVTSFKLYNQNKFSDFQINNKTKAAFLVLARAIEDNMFSGREVGLKLFNSGYKADGIKYVEAAFAKSSAPRIGRHLADLYIKQGNYKKAEEVYRFNTYVEPYRYEPKMDLLDLYKKTNQYRKLLVLSQNIINFPIKIPSENIVAYKDLAKNNIRQYGKHLKLAQNISGSISGQDTIQSNILNKTYAYKVYLPPINTISKRLPVIYITDSDSAVKNRNLTQLLDRLIVKQEIKPVAAVFLNTQYRPLDIKSKSQQRFLCSPDFARFFKKELLNQIESRYPISKDRDDRIILGLSSNNGIPAYLAQKAPDVFKNIAMQTPTFYNCKDLLNSYAQSEKKDFKIYIGYNKTKDTEQHDAAFIETLKHKGYHLKVDMVEGNETNGMAWREQLELIFKYFLGK